MLGGHFGWKKVNKQLLQVLFWDNIEHNYKKLCRECFICQTQKTLPYQLIKNTIQTPLIGNIPLGKIYMDLFQPGRKISTGNVAALVAVDSLTRFVMVELVGNLSAKEVINSMLENIIFKYGVPKKVITDRGTCFSSEEFEKFVKSLNISHHLNTANHHQSNGIVERMNRTFNEAIRIYKDQEWDKTILTSVFCYNNTIHPKTGLSPSYLMFGRNGNLQLTSSNILSWYNIHHEAWKENQNKEDFNLTLKEKDWVLKKRIVDKRGKKSLWNGPYQVMKLDGHQRVLIKKGRQEIWIHASQLKKYEKENENILEEKKEGCRDALCI
ncbi:Integrase, catalytic core domain and Ribonuclease H-like domain-containing protein [Strongyloides ratti]|uniref:RNA-directed DNA polymerase n=1 Tax=Strongyloides ratti TaxID=34506 RepID=A0A090L0M8_STRRB|nr:Integrase, catalytic core domain and Ribonuclease H-like domain-containing protein [Strongyloides ratti]CEF61677.1 Integrase, catalytic core domain and Ribonuclease H-like domain-containing protein [Strongyloides ratti]